MSEGSKLEGTVATGTRWLPRIVEPGILGPIAGATLVLVAAVVTHRISGEIHLADLRAAVSATPWPTVLEASPSP